MVALAHPGNVYFGIAVLAAGLRAIGKIWTNPAWSTGVTPAFTAARRKARAWATVTLLAAAGVVGTWNIAFGITDKPSASYGPVLPISGGYENPAPGNDGSYDCSPGQAPVYVGANDPAGLDADGDGWGCE